jgi:hypothetical protein
MRSQILTSACLGVLMATFSGCDAGDELEHVDNDLTNNSNPFANPFARDFVGWTAPDGATSTWWKCNANEVMVGVHFAQGKLACATLNNGLSVYNTVLNNAPGTQVPWQNVPQTAYMHGCPPGYFVQGLRLNGGAEDLLCVALKSGSIIQGPSDTYVDGYGTSNNGTQSVTTYSLSPNMHVCRAGYAMAGIHRGWNDLFCAR